MPRAHLTELTVRALKPRPQQYRVWDTTTPGFGCLVGGKRKSWIVMFGKRRRMKVLGAFPDLSLADARKAAKKLLLSNADQAPVPTFGAALDRYYAIHFPTLRRSTAYNRKGVLERHFRQWEKKELADITPQHINQMLDQLLSTPGERYQSFKELRTFYRWCVGRQYVLTSPCQALKSPAKPRPRARVLSDEELVTVWHAADQTRPPFGVIIKMLILTGQRRGEVSKLRGEYFDRDKKTITLPDFLAKNGHEHTFPYESMVSTLHDGLPRIGWLFPARCRPQNPFNGFAACKVALDKKSRVDFDLHDLRRTFATKLAQLGVAPHVIERLLNHVRGEISPIAAIYNRHSYLPEMREAIVKWEACLASLLAQRGIQRGDTHTPRAA